MSDGQKPLLLGWQAGSDFGWGVAGLNIFFHWGLSREVKPIMLYPFEERDLLMIDPLRRWRLQAAIDFSDDGAKKLLTAMQRQKLQLDIPVIHALGEGFEVNHKGRISGSKNFGRVVFTDTNTKPHRGRLEPYDEFLCVSEWNANLLRRETARPVHVIHEGIDPALFFPFKKAGFMNPNLFYIFSGGKIEFRKGQDIVLLAFRAFAERHDDAVLLTAWHSPWDGRSEGYKGRLPASVTHKPDGKIDVKKWAADNAVDADKIIDLGVVPNQLMPQVLREMDCALQPSRAEGGTNFVAMEAMACGLPVITARNTGVFDIIDADNCLPLNRQSPILSSADFGREGWGESDIEEIIEALEKLYTSYELRRSIGTKAAAFMKNRNWAVHAEQLKSILLKAQFI